MPTKSTNILDFSIEIALHQPRKNTFFFFNKQEALKMKLKTEL